MTSRAIATVVSLTLAASAVSCATMKQSAARQAAEVLSAKDALVRVEAAMAKHQLRKAKAILEKVQFTQAERPTFEPLVRLSLADATYYLGDDLSLIEARSKFLDFVTLYADHAKAPYAQFQAGMCSVKQIHAASRDQDQTRVAIDDFREIDARWSDSGWARAARQFIGKGQDGLAEHEFMIGSFYWKKKSYRAATSRFSGMLEKFPSYRQKDKIYYWLGRSFMASGSPAEGRVWLDQVLNDYPHSQYVKSARALLAESVRKDAAAVLSK